MREELKARYPDSPLSRQGQTRTERREEKGNA